MKKPFFAVFLLIAFLGLGPLGAEPQDELAQKYDVVSVTYSVPDNDQKHFTDVAFRFAWKNKKPYQIAVQFTNHGYADRKIKFAIKDVTKKKMILLDKEHNSRFGTEMLKAGSVSAVWSGPVDNINDDFSLHVWDSDGDEFDKVAVSIKDQQ